MENKKQHWYYDDGNIEAIIPCNENGKEDGVAKFFNKNGKLQLIIEFKDGVIAGKTDLFNENGEHMIEMSYENNQIHGEQTVYNNEGAVMKTFLFNNGKEV